MARLFNHDITEVWVSKADPNKRYHITKNDRVIRTTGPRGGGAKMLFVLFKDPKSFVNDFNQNPTFNFKGLGRRATATEFMFKLETIAIKEVE